MLFRSAARASRCSLSSCSCCTSASAAFFFAISVSRIFFAAAAAASASSASFASASFLLLRLRLTVIGSESPLSGDPPPKSVCIQHFENLGRGNSSLALALHLIDCARCYAGHAFCHQCQQCTFQHSTRIYAHGLQAHKRLQHDGHDQCSCRRASCLASSSRCKELNTHHGAVPRTTRAGHASLGP